MGCFVCGATNTEKHHIIKRSQSKALIKCELNLVELCPAHHRGHNGVHGRNGHALDMKLRKHFQRKLNRAFKNEYLTSREIKEILGITEVCVDRITKTIPLLENGYLKEDVIRACCGGRVDV